MKSKDTPWEIGFLQSHHISSLLKTHLESFPGFFLTFLGPRFLKEFYSSFLSEETAIALVAEDHSGTVLGFVVGTEEPNGFFKRLLKKRWWRFCLASLNALSRQPEIAFRLFRALFYRGDAPPGAGRALLSSIAVCPEMQSTGLGRALVMQWTEEVRKRGKTGCYLTTDAVNNEKVNQFYQQAGWQISTTYKTPEGRLMNCYVMDF